MGFSSGGGSGSIGSSSDVALSNPANDQVLTYNGSLQKWYNKAAAAALVSSVAGRTGAVVLVASDVGLGSVNNTSDLAKPLSTATQTALNAKAPLASPALTGSPTVNGVAIVGSRTPRTVTGSFTAVEGDSLFVDSSSGPISGTLPTPVAGQREIVIIKISTDNNTVTVVPLSSSVTINGQGAATMSLQFTGASFITDSTNYYRKAA